MTEEPGTRSAAVQSAGRTLQSAIDGLVDTLAALDRDDLGHAFADAVALVRAARGRLIVTGIGKSGHIGRKLAATCASTGTPAYFVHPTEASHGDLGMIGTDDVILALSWSGETSELGAILDYAKRFHVPIIALTAGRQSALAAAATVPLILPKAEEACPMGLAPTTSTLLQLAVGDALAVALLEARGFTASDFKVFHPGGKLGAQLTHVGELMATGDRLPLIGSGATMAEAIAVMSKNLSGTGVVGIIDADQRLLGIITDGDVRRNAHRPLLTLKVEDVMTQTPKVTAPDILAAEALEMMDSLKITSLFVISDGRVAGLIRTLDLLKAGVR